MSQSTIGSSGIIYGAQNFMLPSHMNFGKVLLDSLLKFKNKELIDGATGETVTFGELAQKVVNTAAALKRLGVKRGEVIAICSENRAEFLIAIIAVLCSGAVLTMLNAAYSKDELVHTANISKPKYVFLSADAYKTHNETFKNLNIINKFFIFGNNVESSENISFEHFAKESVDIISFQPRDFYGVAHTALILYSSGTTGLPKGAILTHVNLIVTAHQEQTTSRPLKTLTIAPWCNTMGLLTTTDAIIMGKTMVYMSKFEERTYIENIQKYKIEFLMVAPPILVVLCKSSIIDHYDVSSVEVIASGGAALDESLIDDTKIRFPNLRLIVQGYGMTEMTGIVTRELESASKEGSVGRISAGIVIKIVDIESRKTLGPRQPGEICVKGPVLFSGYIGKPLEGYLDDEGFYKTGDIGYYDEEGYFYIVDRLKELIKYKAWQVSPSELEAVLLMNPAVKDVGVVGIPNQIAGELPTAFVVKKPDANVTEKELINFVASKVSPWKRLRGGVRFVNEIPKTGSGKILRRILRDSLAKPPASKL